MRRPQEPWRFVGDLNGKDRRMNLAELE